MNLSLPIGVMHEGELLREFTLSRPKGGLRAELQDAPDHVAGMDLAALRHVVRSLGPIVNPNDQILRRLTIPDRDYIHAACTAQRYSGNIPVKGKCDCGEEIDDEVTAALIEVKAGEGELRFVNGRACYDLTFTVDGVTTAFVGAVPTLADELKSAEIRAKAAAEAAKGKVVSGAGAAGMERISDAVVTWGPEGRRGPSPKELRDVDMDVFDALMMALNGIKPPHLDEEAEVICPACSRRHTLTLEFDRWLLPFAPPGARKS